MQFLPNYLSQILISFFRKRRRRESYEDEEVGFDIVRNVEPIWINEK